MIDVAKTVEGDAGSMVEELHGRIEGGARRCAVKWSFANTGDSVCVNQEPTVKDFLLLSLPDERNDT